MKTNTIRRLEIMYIFIILLGLLCTLMLIWNYKSIHIYENSIERSTTIFILWGLICVLFLLVSVFLPVNKDNFYLFYVLVISLIIIYISVKMLACTLLLEHTSIHFFSFHLLIPCNFRRKVYLLLRFKVKYGVYDIRVNDLDTEELLYFDTLFEILAKPEFLHIVNVLSGQALLSIFNYHRGLPLKGKLADFEVYRKLTLYEKLFIILVSLDYERFRLLIWLYYTLID